MNLSPEFRFTEVPDSPESVLKLHSRSFWLATSLLPGRFRRSVAKLYAWCRWCDNSVDQSPSPDLARHWLAALRKDLVRIEAGETPLQPASQWLAELQQSHSIPINACHDLLDGMQMDYEGATIRTEQDLILYSYRAAGSVGLMMSGLLGVTGRQADQHAKALGIAMQLTNIARDVGEDWRRGRCYIPSDWRSGNEEIDPESTKKHVRRLLQLADSYYRTGLEGLRFLPATSRLSIRTAAAVYRAIGRQLQLQNYDAVSRRAVVPGHRKLVLLMKCMVAELGFSLRLAWQSCIADFTKRFPIDGGIMMNGEARYLVSLGLSLTLIMATGLFALIGLNPKDSSYQSLPWIYAILSGVLAAGFGALAKRYEATSKLGE